jgi:hypothetical protein
MVSKANAAEGKCIPATWLYHQRDQSIHMTDGMTVTLLSAGLKYRSYKPNGVKPKIITYHLCQIDIRQKLLCKFEKCIFKLHSNKIVQKELAKNETCLHLALYMFSALVCLVQAWAPLPNDNIYKCFIHLFYQLSPWWWPRKGWNIARVCNGNIAKLPISALCWTRIFLMHRKYGKIKTMFATVYHQFSFL